MLKIPVWLDCDTGTDDAVAILLLHALEETEILGMSTVCGNTALNNTFYNTHRLNGLMGTAYPVYAGAECPQIVPLDTAAAFHGKNGLGEVELPIPTDAVFHTEKAWDALYACAKAHPGELRLIATGPLTNVAAAFLKYPDLPELLHSLLIMGGAASFGNVTPAAEFNIAADPHAASMVFRSGMKIVMCGLDVTLQAYLTAEDLDDFYAMGTPAGRFVHDCLQMGLKKLTALGQPGVAMHDSCPVMYLVHPELFEAEEAGVVVETRGTITNGKTVTDLFSDKQFPFKNAIVPLKLDRDQFISILKERISTIR